MNGIAYDVVIYEALHGCRHCNSSTAPAGDKHCQGLRERIMMDEAQVKEETAIFSYNDLKWARHRWAFQTKDPQSWVQSGTGEAICLWRCPGKYYIKLSFLRFRKAIWIFLRILKIYRRWAFKERLVVLYNECDICDIDHTIAHYTY